MRLMMVSLMAIVGFAHTGHAASAGVEQALNDARQHLLSKADELRGQVPPAVERVRSMSNTVDELYVLLQQKYAEGDNNGVVPQRERFLPERIAGQ